MILQKYLSVIEALCSTTTRAKLQRAAEALSLRYRTRQNQEPVFIQTKEEALAYLCVRFPATLSANRAVYEKGFSEQKISIESMCDVGAGCFASFFALEEVSTSLQKVFFIERDKTLVDFGKKIFSEVSPRSSPVYLLQDFTKIEAFPEVDLIAFSYSLGEVDQKNFAAVLEKACLSTKNFILILEPGTPYGFERILAARDFFLKRGLHILSPCPHKKRCPMTQGKWCHFSERLPRTALHKFLKGGDLGYEDEKYSYILVSKRQLEDYFGRIVGRPAKSPGFISMDVCTKEGELNHLKTLKRDKEEYAKIKNFEWGDYIK